LVNAYNNQLKTSLPDTANILNIDAYTASKDEVANPVKYNLTNVTGVACAVASSLTCSAANPPSLNPGVTAASKYLFADGVHPTPYGHQLFALAVTQAMTAKGWY
jgi:phospholipase/lecithinase/hemolysin